jgi:hypothetical protein
MVFEQDFLSLFNIFGDEKKRRMTISEFFLKSASSFRLPIESKGTLHYLNATRLLNRQTFLMAVARCTGTLAPPWWK